MDGLATLEGGQSKFLIYEMSQRILTSQSYESLYRRKSLSDKGYLCTSLLLTSARYCMVLLLITKVGVTCYIVTGG